MDKGNSSPSGAGGRWTGVPRNVMDATSWREGHPATGEGSTSTSQDRQTWKMSDNYQGSRESEQNKSANIPEEKSTSVWLVNLPPDCTLSDLLGNIRGVDKVYSSFINEPKTEEGHYTSAAKIVFWSARGKTTFVDLVNSGQFHVKNYTPRISPNRVRTAEFPKSQKSRVIHVEGPTAVVDKFELMKKWSEKFTYDMETTRTLIEGNSSIGEETTRVEFCFGSFYCQSENAYRFILEARGGLEGMTPTERLLWKNVKVFWGADPCA